jgi:RimJ/RimL family protein N-acetyltransferase
MRLERTRLDGTLVHLEPLEECHFDSLLHAALSNPAVFAHMPYRVADRADIVSLFSLAKQMSAAGSALVFATCVGDERMVVGTTSIRLVDPVTPSVEIGGTWIVPAWQRTRVNTEAKLLQLTHCFEVLAVARVEFKTDARNTRSRAAIARLGATEEGTFRRHMRRHDGTLRDSVFFSIVADEWPRAKAGLESRLASPREPASACVSRAAP